MDLVRMIIVVLLITIAIASFTNNKDYDSTKLGAVAIVENNTNQDKSLGRITGIGGIFFKCNDPESLKKWYGEHFGIKIDEYGTLFEFRLSEDPAHKGYLQWSPSSKAKNEHFGDSGKDFMINYRVTDLEKLLHRLVSEGISVVDDIKTFDYGKFARIQDPEGNVVELWEPGDSVFTRLWEGKTTY